MPLFYGERAILFTLLNNNKQFVTEGREKHRGGSQNKTDPKKLIFLVLPLQNVKQTEFFFWVAPKKKLWNRPNSRYEPDPSDWRMGLSQTKQTDD